MGQKVNSNTSCLTWDHYNAGILNIPNFKTQHQVPLITTNTILNLVIIKGRLNSANSLLLRDK